LEEREVSIESVAEGSSSFSEATDENGDKEGNSDEDRMIEH